MSWEHRHRITAQPGGICPGCNDALADPDDVCCVNLKAEVFVHGYPRDCAHHTLVEAVACARKAQIREAERKARREEECACHHPRWAHELGKLPPSKPGECGLCVPPCRGFRAAVRR